MYEDRRWFEQFEMKPKQPVPTWTIERALEVLLGDELTEEEQWVFERKKHAVNNAEKFVRDFIKRCDCQPRKRAI